MKSFTLFAAMAMTATTMSAAVTVPQTFYEDFVAMCQKGDYPTDGWITYGIDASPIDMFSSYFQPGKPSYVLIEYGRQCLPLSNTNFVPSQEADQWLVSPEIEIPEDAMILGFTTARYWNSGTFGTSDIPYSILVSETGSAEQSAFDPDEPLYSSTVRGSGNSEMILKDNYVSLNGYKGKKIRLAFVQNGQDAGMFGFSNIFVGDYYCRFDNFTAQTAEAGQKITVDMNAYVKTAVECNELEAKLFINGVEAASQVIEKQFYVPRSTVAQPTRITFADCATVTDETISYEVRITPKYEGAMTSVLTGVIGVPVESYPNNCVVEEPTGTGCQYCPIGIAAMEYMSNKYPGTETQGKFIGIAVHGHVNYQDPMGKGQNISSYRTKLMDACGLAGYPSAAFNRATTGTYPYELSFCDSQIAATSQNKVEITAVEYPILADPDDIYDQTVTVKFNMFNSYAAPDLNLKAAVVLIENDVQGYESGYNQLNAFATQTASFVSQYNPLLIQPMAKFLPGGELGRSDIPFDMMVYQHVARGIWPDYNGQAVTASFEANVGTPMTLTFDVPDAVNEWKNTEVVVLLTDGDSGRIVGSDIVDFSTYREVESGVESITTTATGINRSGNTIEVNAEEGTVVNVYALDGTVLGSYVANGGNLSIDATGFNGVVIVKAGTKAAKFIF